MADVSMKTMSVVSKPFLDLLHLQSHDDVAKYEAYIQTHHATQRFLNETDCMLLVARYSKPDAEAAARAEIDLSNNVFTQFDPNALDVFGMKTGPCNISSPNLESSVVFISSHGDPLSAFHQAIHYVYAPQIKGAKHIATNTPLKLDPSLLQALVEMDVSLSRSIALANNDAAGADKDPFRQIYTLADEVAFWRKFASEQSSKPAALARAFAAPLEPLAARYADLAAAAAAASQQALAAQLADPAASVPAGSLPPDSAVLALLDDSRAALLQLWQARYPLVPASTATAAKPQFLFAVPSREAGLKRLLLLLLAAVEAGVKARLRVPGAWWACPYPAFADAAAAAAATIAAARAMVQAVAQDTQRGAHSAAAHASLAGLVHTHPLAALAARVQEMLALRAAVHALHTHARGAGQADEHSVCGVPLASVFGPFAAVDALNVTVPAARSEGPSPWAAAVDAMDAVLAPAERVVAGGLVDKLLAARGQPAMLLHLCAAHAALLRRPHARALLRAHRGDLAHALAACLDARRAEFASAAADGAGGGGWARRAGAGEQGSCVSGLLWTAQLTAKLDHLAAVVAAVAGDADADADADAEVSTDLSAAAGLRAGVRSLAEEVLQLQNRLFDRWQRAALEVVQAHGLAAGGAATAGTGGAGQLMQLDATRGGMLRVFFDERLVALVREVRQLRELGFASRMAPAVRAGVAGSQCAYRYSLRIKQAANFYNAFHHEVRPSQLGLLLADAQAFEAKVRENTLVDWSNADRANAYLDALGALMQRLERHNGALRDAHARIAAAVAELAATELAGTQQRSDFGDRVAGVARMIEAAHAHTQAALGAGTPAYPAEALALWRRHWHAQVFKAVCVRYQCLLHDAAAALDPLPCQLTVDMDALARARDAQANAAAEAASEPSDASADASAPRLACPAGLDADAVFSFAPPLPALRGQLYRALDSLVALPTALPAVATPEEARYRGPDAATGFRSLYSALPLLYAPLVRAVYEEAGRAVADLALMARRHQRWLRVLWLDEPAIAALAAAHLRSADDWAGNFAALSLLYKEALAVPAQARLCGFVVSLGSLRSQLLRHLDQCYAWLLLRLKADLLARARALEDYLAEATGFLSVLPSSLEAMAASRRRWQELQRGKQAHKDALGSVVALDALLDARVSSRLHDLATGAAARRPVTAASASLGLVSVSALRERWEELERLLAGYSGMLEHEREALRGVVEADAAKLCAEVDKFASRWQALRPVVPEGEPVTGAFMADALAALRDWEDEYALLAARAAKVAESCSVFDLPPPAEHAARLEALHAGEIAVAAQAFAVYHEYQLAARALTLEKWVDVRPRLNAFEDLLKAWQRKLRGGRGGVTELLVAEVRRGLAVFPLLKKVTGDCFQPDHWRALFHKLGMKRATAEQQDDDAQETPAAATAADAAARRPLPALVSVPLSVGSVTLHDFLLAAPALQQHAQWITDLCARAQGEALVREAVDELKLWAATAQFATVAHDCTPPRAGATGVFVPRVALIRQWKPLFAELADKRSLVLSLRDSPFYAPYEDVCAQFEARMGLLAGVLAALQAVQRQWLYLEPVFQRGALPAHYALFAALHADFVAVSQAVEADPSVMALAHVPGLEQTVAGMTAQLEQCHRVLALFLEAKRGVFPRFYFVSDDDLLAVLGQGDDAAVINAHVKKLFFGMHSVVFADDPAYAGADPPAAPPAFIVGFRSKLRETVFLRTPVRVTGRIEQWLQLFTRAMEEALRHSLAHALHAHRGLYDGIDGDGPAAVRPFAGPGLHSLCAAPVSLLGYPAQVLALAHSVLFADLVERAIHAQRLPRALALLQSHLDQLTALDVPALARALHHAAHAAPVPTLAAARAQGEFLGTDVQLARQWVGASAAEVEAVLQHRVTGVVMDLIHHIDVAAALVHAKAAAADAWAWAKELRAYVPGPRGDSLLRAGGPDALAGFLEDAARAPSALLAAQALDMEVSAAALAAEMQQARVAAWPAVPAPEDAPGGAFTCVWRMANTEHRYTFEYQGNEGRLAYTPLTEKCYTVLTQALHLGYGGSPYGPAGTGKTESVKALGQLLGRQVLVFNCDEGLDFGAMNRIFVGLVKAGAWGCFDEFNRLKADQLSTISQQIQAIQLGLKRHQPEVTLLGQPVPLSPHAALFVTMNPASKEYGGRSQLPHNLKELFRAVAMSVPDNALIAKVILQAEGFQHAARLGSRLTQLFALCREGLSQQRHYDWGLRSLKIVLGHAGRVVQGVKQRRAAEGGPALSEDEEAAVLVAVLNSNTLSKLTYADHARFARLVETVFPRVRPHVQDHARLEEAVRAAMRARGLAVVEAQVHKAVQLHDSLAQRMGVVVMGASGSGKSTLLAVLRDAMAALGLDMRSYAMNPKAVARELLLGRMDRDTHEWHDGVLTLAARKAMGLVGGEAEAEAAEGSEGADSAANPTANPTADPAADPSPGGVRSWIVCDGDVDPEWIEAFNSVLDDNKLLTMPNGARIKFDDSVNFVFETHSLAYASPATISRMNIIFINDEDLSYQAIADSWLASQHPDAAALLRTHVPALLDCVARALEVAPLASMAVPTTRVGHLKAVLACVRGCTGRQRFAAHLARGLTANLPLDRRAPVLDIVLQAFGVRLPAAAPAYVQGKVPTAGEWDPRLLQHMPLPTLKAAAPAALGGAQGPGADAPFQVYTTPAPAAPQRLAAHAQAVRAGTEQPDPALRPDFDCARPAAVLTPSLQAAADTLRMWLSEDTLRAMSAPPPPAKPASAPLSWPAVLLEGPPAAGKATLLHAVLAAEPGVLVATLDCTPHTRAAHVLDTLLSVTAAASDARGKLLRPRDGKARAVLVVRHPNVIRADAYGTVEAVALLQQLVTMRGFYDPATLEWVALGDVQLVCTLTADGPARLGLTPRLVANMCVLHLPAAPASELAVVAHHTLAHMLAQAPQWLYDDVPGLALAQQPAPLVDDYAAAFPALAALVAAAPPAHPPLLIASGATAQEQHPLSLQFAAEPPAADWRDPAALLRLAALVVDVYTHARAAFAQQAAAEPHYAMTPRDLLRVLSLLAASLTTPRSLPHALAHAFDVVYGARLRSCPARHPVYGLPAARAGSATPSDALAFESLVRTRIRTHLQAEVLPWAPVYYSALLSSLDVVPELVTQAAPLQLQPDQPAPAEPDYEAVYRHHALTHANLYRDVVVNAVDAYVRDCRPVAVTVAAETLRLFSLLERRLAGPAGHLALVAREGTGLRDLACVAAHMLKLTVYSPPSPLQLQDDSGPPPEADDAAFRAFRGEFRELVRGLLVNKARVALVLDEPHLRNPHVMAVVATALAQGDLLRRLCSPAEADAILSALRPEFQALPAASAPPSLAAYVQRLLADHLRVVVAVDPLLPLAADTLALPAVAAHCLVVSCPDRAPATYAYAALSALRGPLTVVNRELVAKATAFLRKHGATADSAHTLPAQQQQQLATIVKRDGAHAISLLYALHATRAGRGFGATLGSFRSVLRVFAGLFTAKRAALVRRRERLQHGLAKLREAAASVAELRTQAQAQQVLVSAKQEQADAALQTVSAHMGVVVQRQGEVAQLQAHLGGEEEKLAARRAVVERELDEILPMVRAAQEAVGTIQKDHLNEIKAYKTPPAAITHVLGAVLTLLGVQDLTWSSMRKFLSDPGIKDRIINFDASRASKPVRGKVAALVRQHADAFEPHKIRSVSVAAAPLAEWVKAQVRFAAILEEVEPKQQELRQADALLDSSRVKMRECAAELAAVEEQVQRCRASFGETTAEAERLKLGLATLTETLRSAESLFGKLGGELERWDGRVREYGALLLSLPYECVIAASACVYLAYEDEAVRDAFLDRWRAMCGLKQADVMRVLASPRQTARWRGVGVGADAVALMNCGMLANLYRHLHAAPAADAGADAAPAAELPGHTALLVDPNRVATRWLRECLDDPDADAEEDRALADLMRSREQEQERDGADPAASEAPSEAPARGRKAEMVFCSLHSERVVSSVELAVRFGKTLVLTDVDRVPAFLYPLLRRTVTAQPGSGRLCVRVGEKLFDWHAGFRLVLVTHDALDTSTRRAPVPDATSLADLAAPAPDAAAFTRLPALPADIACSLSVANFAITEAGLADQLLAVAVDHQSPQLERQKQQLLATQEQCHSDLAVLEGELLQLLAESRTALLENAALVAKLDVIKARSLAVAQTLAEGEAVQATLQAQRTRFSGIAVVATRLYFTLSQLHAVNHMYQFALQPFLRLYTQTLDQYSAGQAARGPGEAQDVEAAVAWLSTALRRRVYAHVAQTTFSADRGAICLLLLRALRPDLGTVAEWAQLSGVAAAVDADAQVPAWVPAHRAAAVRKLLGALPHLRALLRLDEPHWGVWAASPRPDENFPVALSAAELSVLVPPEPAAPGPATLLHVLLLVQAVLPHRLPDAIERVAAGQLGLETLAAPAPALAAATVAATAAPVQPLLFMSAAGVAIGGEVAQYAAATEQRAFAQALLQLHQQHRHDDDDEAAAPTLSAAQLEQLREAPAAPVVLTEVALGSGQTGPALALVSRAAQRGEWVLLKNLHLVAAWLPVLEKHLAALPTPHPLFRLFLTTEATPAFPAALLARSAVRAFEQPPGIRNNVLHTLAGWGAVVDDDAAADAAGPDYFSLGSPARAQLLFLLALLHAVLLERRAFLPQGWIKHYDFAASDLRAAADTVDQLFADGPAAAAELAQRLATGAGASYADCVLHCQRFVAPASLRWDALWGLLRAACYGGRIDNDSDLRVLHLLMRKYLAADVLSPANPAAMPTLAGSAAPSAAPAARRVVLGQALPASTRMADFVAFAKTLPQTSSSLLELPPNAALEADRARALASTATLKLVAQVAATQGDATPLAALPALLQLWRAAVARLTATPAASAAPLDPAPETCIPLLSRPAAARGAVEACVGQEAAILRVLIARVGADLAALAAVAQGTRSAGALAPTLDALERGIVPAPWQAALGSPAWAPATPAQLLAQLAAKAAFVAEAVALLNRAHANNAAPGAAPDALLQRPIALAHVVRPSALLNALRQHCAAAADAPLDSLELVAAFDPAALPPALPRMQLAHLFLTGADVLPLRPGNNDPAAPPPGSAASLFALSEPAADAPSFAPLPALHLTYAPVGADGKPPVPAVASAQVRGQPLGVVAVDIFADAARLARIATARLPCAVKPAKAVLCGAALVAELDA